MKKTLVLIMTLTLSQLALAKTTFICKINELSSDKGDAQVWASHSIEVRPMQKMDLTFKSLNMVLKLQGSEADDELDLVRAEAIDLATHGKEGGLMFDLARLSNGKGQTLTVSCTAK